MNGSSAVTTDTDAKWTAATQKRAATVLERRFIRTPLFLRQVLVEPVGQHGNVIPHIGPSVSSARLDDQLARNVYFLQLVDDQLGLLDGHKLVGVAVNNKGWRVVGADVIHRRDLLSDLKASGLVCNQDE